MKVTLHLRGNKMRADYGFYVVAIICFMIAGLVLLEAFPQYLPELVTFEGTVIAVISTAFGLIFVILGYALRPKLIISIPETPKSALPPSSSSAVPPIEEAITIPSRALTPPTPTREETAKPERKKTKTRRKRTKRRREKT